MKHVLKIEKLMDNACLVDGSKNQLRTRIIRTKYKIIYVTLCVEHAFISDSDILNILTDDNKLFLSKESSQYLKTLERWEMTS